LLNCENLERGKAYSHSKTQPDIGKLTTYGTNIFFAGLIGCSELWHNPEHWAGLY